MLSRISRPPRLLIVLSPNHTISSRLNCHMGSTEIITTFSFQDLPVEFWAGCGFMSGWPLQFYELFSLQIKCVR